MTKIKTKPLITQGDTFKMVYADSNPLWKVVKPYSTGTKKTFVVEIVSGEFKGIQRVMSEPEIFRLIKYSETWKNIQTQGDKEWFAAIKRNNLKPGDFIHDIGRNKGGYRCVLQVDGSIKRVGFVGELQSFQIPVIHYQPGGKLEIWKGALKGLEEKPQIWGNRPGDFPELKGDFSWQTKPETKLELPKITEEVKLKKERLDIISQTFNDYQYDKISFDEFQKIINNLKSI